MDTQSTPADRIRPVLKAMEQSIDQARRKRMNHGPALRPLHDSTPAHPALHQMLPPSPLQIHPIPKPAAPTTQPLPTPHAEPNGTMRLKAKPKREPSPFFDSPMTSSQQTYRTAG